MQQFAPLPRHQEIAHQMRYGKGALRKSTALHGASKGQEAPGKFESAAWITRSALCAEPRNGLLYVFMPPLEALDDYVGLVAAIETTAAELGFPVLLEGYEPPKDPRLQSLRITPDRVCSRSIFILGQLG